MVIFDGYISIIPNEDILKSFLFLPILSFISSGLEHPKCHFINVTLYWSAAVMLCFPSSNSPENGGKKGITSHLSVITRGYTTQG